MMHDLSSHHDFLVGFEVSDGKLFNFDGSNDIAFVIFVDKYVGIISIDDLINNFIINFLFFF